MLTRTGLGNGHGHCRDSTEKGSVRGSHRHHPWDRGGSDRGIHQGLHSHDRAIANIHVRGIHSHSLVHKEEVSDRVHSGKEVGRHGNLWVEVHSVCYRHLGRNEPNDRAHRT